MTIAVWCDLLEALTIFCFGLSWPNAANAAQPPYGAPQPPMPQSPMPQPPMPQSPQPWEQQPPTE